MRRGTVVGQGERASNSATTRKSQRQWNQVGSGMRTILVRLSISAMVVILCMFSLVSQLRPGKLGLQQQQQQLHMDVKSLWNRQVDPSGWRPSSAPRSTWPPPTETSNGYLVVRCNGGLNQQRGAICNAVLAARIMNATLVLPELDTNSFWNDKGGFPGIYDVEHFIKTLEYDVKIVESLPATYMVGNKKKKLKPYQIKPPRDAPPSWYETVALEKMKDHGAVYLTPFSHRLSEDLENDEYQRLRCRVNFHALRFRPDIMQLSNHVVNRLRSHGHFMAIHLRFEMDMLAFAGCVDIFNPKEQEILRKYRKQNFAEKRLVYDERKLIGKCPLTPEEVGLVLRSMGFDNRTRIYLAAGELFGGERFMAPLRKMFPRLENRSTVLTSQELAAFSNQGRGLLGPAVDYMVCLLADIFMPTYDGPSNFANNLLGHRLYYGFRPSIQPNRKALAPIFMEMEKSKADVASFQNRIREVMLSGSTLTGLPHQRVNPESFYTNPWPECFCKRSSSNPAEVCPATSIMNRTLLLQRRGPTTSLLADDDLADGNIS